MNCWNELVAGGEAIGLRSSATKRMINEADGNVRVKSLQSLIKTTQNCRIGVEEFTKKRGLFSVKAREAEFITVTDAAEMADCSRNAVLKWINEGKVEAVKVSGRFRVWQSSLNQHLQKKM